ncbi:MAG: hypothetical protein HC802_02930 [Caldilineaceae bacterium]|nr:hypothetical protein [Caldilineaceae bacterium]
MKRLSLLHLIVLLLPVTFLAGCRPLDRLQLQNSPPPVTVATDAVSNERLCDAGAFVAHELDHVTTAPGNGTVAQFGANGGGVAINDLDGDGDLDLVLANQSDPNTIQWNEATCTSDSQPMATATPRRAYHRRGWRRPARHRLYAHHQRPQLLAQSG